ncbi:hypothetical protein IWQ62_004743 [Dispira parvispora]|uniref:Uncharacterized protein n=1 Tax=Dispira parvispora TaxID=1520584 RepID=A0A9W8ALT4_9FUNG|nr:hypothetical protein IWQ62_004743 [Dispira parvispora]
MPSPMFYAAQRRLAAVCASLGGLLMVLAIILFGLHTRWARKKYMGHKVSRRMIYASWSLLLAGSFLMLIGHILVMLNVSKAESEDAYQGAAHPQPVAYGGGHPHSSMPRQRGQEPLHEHSEYNSAGDRRKNSAGEVHVQFPQPQ